MSDDLAMFLAARLDEDEAGHREIHEARVCSGCSDGWEAGFDPDRCDCGHPARVLREVELHRDVLSHYRTVADWGPGNWPMTLRLLAAVWSDHPDYDPEMTL